MNLGGYFDSNLGVEGRLKKNATLFAGFNAKTKTRVKDDW